jgi:hypothetical protein
MSVLLDRRVIAVIGAIAALILAVVVALAVMRGKHGAAAAGGATPGALQIEQGQADSRTASTKALRCFVGGQFVGMATVAECAQKNGVAAQALDVGLDPATGQATSPSGSLAPPPPPAQPAPPAQSPDANETRADQTIPPPAGPAGECLRYLPDGWRTAGSNVSLGQCARLLFDGRCAHAGEALYGRWAAETLRLVTGRVEMSTDNRTFHSLAAQNPQDCSIPAG